MTSLAVNERQQEAVVIDACRSCGGGELLPVLSLGETPLANALLAEEQLSEVEPCYPLELVFCPACSLVQITVTVPPQQLFADYPYFSSFSDTTLRSAEALVERLIDERRLDVASLAAEIASNDGYLLQNYVARGVPVLGIEPACNVARIAEERGVATRNEFFGRELAERLIAAGLQADVIHANNVLAHVPDLNGVIAGISCLLKPGGLAVIEVPYLRDLIEHCEFDTIYHEHLCYFSASALDRLFTRNSLILADVEHIPLHGGSLRVSVGHAGTAVSGRVEALLQEEHECGILEARYYKDFSARVSRLGRDLRDLLQRLKQSGARIAAYGASAKGSTLLNVFELDRNVIDYVVDRSTVKQGRYTPGTHLPILPPEILMERRPDYVLLLTWNFADEILAQQAAYKQAGGRFIVPVPEVTIV